MRDPSEDVLSAIWQTSSDILIVSKKSVDGLIQTQLSPAIYKMLKVPRGKILAGSDKMLILEQNSNDELANEDKSAYEYPCHLSDAMLGDLKEFIARGWGLKKTLSKEEEKGVLSHEIHLDEKESSSILHVEANVTFINELTFVMIARDVTERMKRFEAEKKIVEEHIARKKDDEINRFIRHEVKNGLLAAIGLCDDLRENITEGAGTIEEKKFHNGKLDEIDSNLNQTLDIVSTQAMARDLINGEYTPRNEVVDINELYDIKKKCTKDDTAGNSRFPVTTYPSPFPLIEIDPMILNCVHRNAVTNAIKYGKEDGTIKTIFKYHENRKMFELQVMNDAGQHHGEILELGNEKTNEVIFSPGESLHVEDERKQLLWEKNVSSGDGAWVMKQCASSMGGTCDIKFTETQTIFRLLVPIKTVDTSSKRNSISSDSSFSKSSSFGSFDSFSSVLNKFSSRAANQVQESTSNATWTNNQNTNPPKTISTTKLSDFSFPENTWFVAIDDSAVQRKLLKRWLTKSKIPEDRAVVLGSTKEEIAGFVNYIVNLMISNPNDNVVIIADENMDTVNETTGAMQTYSGSLMIQQILRILKEQYGTLSLESKCLALVRSSNDSSKDILMFNRRAHGFLPKNPMGNDSLMNLVIKAWLRRYPAENIFGSICRRNW